MRWIVRAVLYAVVLAPLIVAAGKPALRPIRVHFSANMEGEIEPCGCHVPKGGLARRAGYLAGVRVDSVMNLTIDAGNFSPAGRLKADSIKVTALTDFFRDVGYDAIALSSRETSFGFEFWREQADHHLPVLAANVFTDPKAKKPLFKGWKSGSIRSNGQYLLKDVPGGRIGVVGFVTESAWNARRDPADGFTFRSPFDCEKLMRKACKQCDVLIVTGEFKREEADSFAHKFPEIDLIVSSGIRTDQLVRQGTTSIIGTTARGYFANYLEWNPALSGTEIESINKSQVLDSTAAEDSSWARRVKEIKILSNAAIPGP